MTIAQTVTSSAQKTIVRRGRPAIVPQLTDDEKANAVRCVVIYNMRTGKFDYDVAGGAITGSAKKSDYLRNRIMGGELKKLADVSFNYTRAFRVELIDAYGKYTEAYVVKSK